MATMLSKQERRLLAAARAAGTASTTTVRFDWKLVGRSAGIRTDEVQDLLRGLRRFGFIEGITSTHAVLTDSGLRAAEEVTPDQSPTTPTTASS